GCGWLGFPLAKHLIEEGYKVKGSATSVEKISLLAEAGIQPFLINLDNTKREISEGQGDFFDCDLLIINIPPKVRSQGEEFHPQQIATIINHKRAIKSRQVIYISATSIYPPACDTVDEDTALSIDTTGNKALYRAEQLLQREKHFRTLIFRCGGLLGYDRIPGRYFEGKTISIGNSPVNYIHRDDAVAIIAKAIKKELQPGIYNMVAPVHPTKKEVFLKNALDFGFIPPKFEEVDEAGYKKKLVLGVKVMEALPYEYLYPDPLDFFYTNRN